MELDDYITELMDILADFEPATINEKIDWTLHLCQIKHSKRPHYRKVLIKFLEELTGENFNS